MEYMFSDKNCNDTVTIQRIVTYSVSDRIINTTVLRNEQETPI